MKKELDELITVLDDAVDMQDNARYQDLLDSSYQDGLFHELRRYLNKKVELEQNHSKKIDELHIFLQESNVTNYYHFGKHVIDVAIEVIKEQAERVKELENILDQDHRQEVLEGLYEQNKRYREAIENVLEIENYGVATDYIKTVTNILLEALEEYK